MSPLFGIFQVVAERAGENDRAADYRQPRRAARCHRGRVHGKILHKIIAAPQSGVLFPDLLPFLCADIVERLVVVLEISVVAHAWINVSKPRHGRIGAVLTLVAAQLVIPALPYLLSFAAGAMLYVVVEELIPEMSQGEHSNIGTVFFAVGFSVMMVLDVALG